jgi:sortase B
MSEEKKELTNIQQIDSASLNEVIVENITNEEAQEVNIDIKQEEQSENMESEDLITSEGLKHTINLYKLLRIFFAIGFVVFLLLFLNEVFITPYRIQQSIKKTSNLYKPTTANVNPITATPAPTLAPSSATDKEEANSTVDSDGVSTVPDLNRDNQGRLLQFKELLAVNEDVKGWINIPESNIDYVVMQSGKEDPEFYLNRDIEKLELKAGSLFLDAKCSIEDNSQNLTIHGHNMTSTDNMFHYLIKYKELEYYKKRPVFTFDTIYQTGQWKIFAVFITNGGSEKEELFRYTRPSFNDSGDFLNYVYQLRIRSMYHIDTVDINENDQLLTLSTCSYEVKNYRTVIVARKVREGEDPTVEVASVTINPEPLYPYTYYYRYGGKAPALTETFEEALKNGEINWYKPTEADTN